MPFDFTHRRAVITGGANGIGSATAELFARSGAAVTILDLAKEKPGAQAETYGGRGLECDVTDPASVQSAFAKTGPVDLLVINAGIGRESPLEQTADELWQQTLAINLTGAFYCLRAAIPFMKQRGRGAIVITASTNSFDGEPHLSAYNASKAGLLGVVHTAAAELGPYGIRINAVCPGLIRTRLTSAHFAKEQVMRPYFQAIPLGRGGEPEEVARAIAFLASDDASFITGTTLTVDGGQMASKFGIWSEEIGVFEKDRWKLKDK